MDSFANNSVEIKSKDHLVTNDLPEVSRFFAVPFFGNSEFVTIDSQGRLKEKIIPRVYTY